jgi:glycosyltransferase involved in cell wall biosynthesis
MDALRVTIESIFLCDTGGHNVRLYVCDNGSSDGTKDYLSSLNRNNLSVYTTKTPGKSACLNRMITETSSEVLLFTDDDVIVATDWIVSMVDRLLIEHGDGVVGGVKVASSIRPVEWTQEHLMYFASTEHVRDGDSHPFIGANYCIRRAVYDRIGGFNPLVGPGQFGHAEDTLFWLQCREQNVKIVNALDIVVFHYPDLRRLNDAGIRSLARKQGEFEAYIDFHWEWYRRPFILASCLRRLMLVTATWLVYLTVRKNSVYNLQLATNIRDFSSAINYVLMMFSSRHYARCHGTQHDYCVSQRRPK